MINKNKLDMNHNNINNIKENCVVKNGNMNYEMIKKCFDHEYCYDEVGKSLFMCELTIEMSKYTKQYEQNTIDITENIKDEFIEYEKQIKKQLIKEKKGNDEDDDLELLFGDMNPDQVVEALRKLKSGQVVQQLLEELRKEDETKKKTSNISKRMGIAKRMLEMEERGKQFPHLQVKGLNRMVRDGYLSDGVELAVGAEVKDAAVHVGKGIKSKSKKKHSDGRADEGIGFRPPFFTLQIDLVDLTK